MPFSPFDGLRVCSRYARCWLRYSFISNISFSSVPERRGGGGVIAFLQKCSDALILSVCSHCFWLPLMLFEWCAYGTDPKLPSRAHNLGHRKLFSPIATLQARIGGYVGVIPFANGQDSACDYFHESL